jgi:hypothetical protein
MKSFDDYEYRVAVPDEQRWETQLRKIPAEVCKRLNLRLYLVSKNKVHTPPLRITVCGRNTQTIRAPSHGPQTSGGMQMGSTAATRAG